LYFSHVEATGGFAKWWEARKNRTLRELQVEAYEWTIGEEEKLGFKDAQQRKEILTPLMERLAELRGGAVTRPAGATQGAAPQRSMNKESLRNWDWTRPTDRAGAAARPECSC
jgi:hypothetical protein